MKKYLFSSSTKNVREKSHFERWMNDMETTRESELVGGIFSFQPEWGCEMTIWLREAADLTSTKRKLWARRRDESERGNENAMRKMETDSVWDLRDNRRNEMGENDFVEMWMRELISAKWEGFHVNPEIIKKFFPQLSISSLYLRFPELLHPCFTLSELCHFVYC